MRTSTPATTKSLQAHTLPPFTPTSSRNIEYPCEPTSPHASRTPAIPLTPSTLLFASLRFPSLLHPTPSHPLFSTAVALRRLLARTLSLLKLMRRLASISTRFVHSLMPSKTSPWRSLKTRACRRLPSSVPSSRARSAIPTNQQTTAPLASTRNPRSREPEPLSTSWYPLRVIR